MSYSQVYKREIKNNSCLAFKIVTQKFCSFWHSHPEFEIVYIESGSGYLKFGQQKKEYKKGDIFLLGPWIPHQFIEISENHVSISLLFNYNFIMPGFLDSDILSEIKIFLEKTYQGMLFRENKLHAEVNIIKLILLESGLEQAIYLLSLLKRLANFKKIKFLSEGCSIPMSSKKFFKIQKILYYISKNASEKLLLNEIANHFYMSQSHFSRFFHEQMGVTFSQYVMNFRINNACEMLANSSIPITQISQNVGFETISSFNRNFVKFRGCTPRDFRKINIRGLTI